MCSDEDEKFFGGIDNSHRDVDYYLDEVIQLRVCLLEFNTFITKAEAIMDTYLSWQASNRNTIVAAEKKFQLPLNGER
jgi:hypothetical protein